MERLAGKVILLSGWRKTLTAILAGMLAALSQPPFDFFAVCFISFPILVWLLDGISGFRDEPLLRRIARPFFVGWCFGFGYFVAGLWWTGKALLVEADLFAWALPLAVLGLPAVLAIFYGFATALARLFWTDGLSRLGALAFAFGLAEWLRSFLFTGFPWNAIGQALMPVPLLMQSVGVVGFTGMNTLAVLIFATPALLAAPHGRRAGFALATVLVSLHFGYGAFRLAGADDAPETLVNVRVVQASIDQTEKWDSQVRDRIFASYLDLTVRTPAEGAATPDLIIWPETSVPFILSERPDALVALDELLQPDQTLLAGAVRVEAAAAGQPERYYNAVVAINDAGETYDAVDKVHLVPFGEYLPFGEVLSQFGMSRLVQSVSDFSAGGTRHAIETATGVRALPFICYEIIFPSVASGKQDVADLILNVTNDAWFGDTPGPYQHFRLAQIRAVESGLPMVRAANNGVSGVVDAYGRVIDAFAINAIGVLDVAVPRQRLEPLFSPNLAGMGLLGLFGVWMVGARLFHRRFN